MNANFNTILLDGRSLTSNMKAAIFESLPLSPLALPLSPLDDVIFAYSFCDFYFFGKNFFQTSQDKTSLLSLYRTKLYGLSSKRCAYGCSQGLGFGATLKRKIQSHDRYVSADVNFYERPPRSLK